MKKRSLGILFALMLCTVLVACGDDSEKGKTLDKTSQPAVTQGPKVEYVSSEDALSQAEQILSEMALDDKIGQLFMVNLELLDSSKGDYRGFTKLTKAMKKSLAKYRVGGIYLDSRNVKDKKQLTKLIADLQKSTYEYPMYIATDEEGGEHSLFKEKPELGGTVYPMASQMGASEQENYLYNAGRTTGAELRSLGFNVNFAPVADVGDMEKNAPYLSQCYNEDAELAGEAVEQLVTGMRDSGMGTTLKHFPGVGSVYGTIDETVINSDSSLSGMRDREFVPFSSGISAESDFIMISSVAVNKVTRNAKPASMSKVIMNDILRDELGYNGVVITDFYNTPVIKNYYPANRAALEAVKAGADMVLSPEHLGRAFSSIKYAISDKELDSRVLDAAVLRVLQDKIERGIISSQEEDTDK